MTQTTKTPRAKPRARRPRPAAAAAQGTDAIRTTPQPLDNETSRGEAEPEHTLERTLETLSVDHATAERLQKLPHDIGWLLVTAGVVGVVMPGVLGVPFLLLGGLILTPATNRRAESWLAGHAPGVLKGSMRQVNRFLDDLERRYPRSQGK